MSNATLSAEIFLPREPYYSLSPLTSYFLAMSQLGEQLCQTVERIEKQAPPLFRSLEPLDLVDLLNGGSLPRSFLILILAQFFHKNWIDHDSPHSVAV